MSAVGRDVLHIGAKSLFASPARQKLLTKHPKTQV